VERSLEKEVNVPPDGNCQYVAALGAAILGHLRLQKRGMAGASASTPVGASP